MTKLVPRCAVSWSGWRRRFVESVLIKHFAASKFEIRSSKSETKGKRSKSEFKNSKLETSWFGIFFSLNIWICFEFRNSNFELGFITPLRETSRSERRFDRSFIRNYKTT